MGRSILLRDQDRSLWDDAQIAEGRAVLDRALVLGGRDVYVLQAAIASAPLDELVTTSAPPTFAKSRTNADRSLTR
jgi:predicted RNA polymerase sigma factor